MPNYAFDSPHAVFIHIPQNGHDKIRFSWPTDSKIQTFGYIPDYWSDAIRFAVIRDPFQRFIAAIHMFKYGTAPNSGYYARARWPDLTIDQALEVLVDDQVGFDRSSRALDANLKHHLLPQTHPFNCLQFADHFLHHENLDDDLAAFSQKLGIRLKLRKIERTNPHILSVIRDALTDKQIGKLQDICAEDYRQLGYSLRGEITSKPKIVNETRSQIWPEWPAYFSNRRIDNDCLVSALPDISCDLDKFRKVLVPGKRSKTWPGREKDLNKHFHRLQPEFAGLSRLSHLLACTIVAIRRSGGDNHAKRLFFRIVGEYDDLLARELNLRWLTAVCDTFVDHDIDPLSRAHGLIGSTLANTVKLYETELRLFYPKIPNPPTVRFDRGGELFDGVISFWVERGDLIKNLFQRSERALEAESNAAVFVEEIFKRCMNSDTAFKRLDEMSRQSNARLIREEDRKITETLIKSLEND